MRQEAWSRVRSWGGSPFSSSLGLFSSIHEYLGVPERFSPRSVEACRLRVGATIDHRLGPTAKLPVMVEDIYDSLNG